MIPVHISEEAFDKISKAILYMHHASMLLYAANPRILFKFKEEDDNGNEFINPKWIEIAREELGYDFEQMDIDEHDIIECFRAIENTSEGIRNNIMAQLKRLGV